MRLWRSFTEYHSYDFVMANNLYYIFWVFLTLHIYSVKHQWQGLTISISHTFWIGFFFLWMFWPSPSKQISIIYVLRLLPIEKLPLISYWNIINWKQLLAYSKGICAAQLVQTDLIVLIIWLAYVYGTIMLNHSQKAT